MDSDKKVVLITGGNTGIGFEIAKALAKSATIYEIIIGSRDSDKGQAAVREVQSVAPGTSSVLSTLLVDLESDESLENVVETVRSKYGRLDVLVNNAGMAPDPAISMGKLSIRQGFNMCWNVNVTGTHLLTTLAAPLLLQSSDPRIIFMTSGLASLDITDISKYPERARFNQSPSAGWPKDMPISTLTAYRSSKSALNMLMREWHRILLSDGVKVWALSPGLLATGLGGAGPERMKQMGALDPSIAGDLARNVIEGQSDQDVGRVIKVDGSIEPW